MWISSFVVTLAPDTAHQRAVLDAIDAIPVFQLGELVGAKLPVVLETNDGATARDWFEWVAQLPGVVHVDVAFVSFEEMEPSQ